MNSTTCRNNDNSVIVFNKKKFYALCIFLTFIILSVSVFFIYFNKRIPDSEQNVFVDDKNINNYIESILFARKSDDISRNNGFSNIVDYIYQKMFEKYSKDMNLTREETKKLMDDYYADRSKIISNIHQSMVEKESYQDKKEIDYEYLDSVNGFSESISVFACEFLMITSSYNNPVKNAVLEPLCKGVLSEVIEPVTQSLKDKAIIKDVENITFNIKERAQASILQLATAKNMYKFDVNDTVTRTIDFTESKIPFLNKLNTDQEATVTAEAKAIAIAGFDLDEMKIKIEHENKTIYIYLPYPIIMSDYVTGLEFTGESREWFSPEINLDSYNRLMRKAEAKAYSCAMMDNDLFQQAEKNAKTSIMNIFQPIMHLPQFNYEVQVLFDNTMINYNLSE